MSSKNLIEIIRAYQGSPSVRVEVYFKNGKVGDLGHLLLENDMFVFPGGMRLPISMVSHAEITAA
ncbi:MAG: hypothetical protein J0L75_19935 [Spirochaetes bacterium]|nr:hypothetical protein [Spirochaetota bacterium]